MNINRDICKKVNCEWFTAKKRSGLARYKSIISDTENLRPKIPKTGLCAYTHWHVYNGFFDDELEVPPECPYKVEMAVTQ